ncbi:MAG: tRNA (adenosine(37)-N6)-threonylcarbamoyltransferase complex ATPase subunit type 1 TsaE [Candidatus Omnitrophica bacterium]|nr:tRNA (adenosine(37)-N6)-threonylcarbamoyltransferase complex ATPase subunit type 1 TsaE [Candidatus Omnitrophota bacterium]
MSKRSSATSQSASTFELVSHSLEETQALGEQFGRLLKAGDVVAFYGELGSGKTTMIQGIARGLGREQETLKSPTFVLMREYAPGPPSTKAARPGSDDQRAGGAGGDPGLVHIDGCRLEGASAVAWLDVDLIFSPHKITLIEWAERFEGFLPEDHIKIRLNHVSTNRRRITVVAHGTHAASIVAALQPPATPAPSSAAPSESDSDAPVD